VTVDEPGHAAEPNGRYQHAFVEGGSYRAAVELVARSARHDGLVVDLGCGFGAVAEPLAELGLTYVGTDVAADGLADLAARGFETHLVDLGAAPDELRARLDEVAGDRAVAHVLTLDVLEHLPDPGRVAAVLAGFAADHGAADLVVSYPNVTHLDVAAKLLVGRWDRTDEGLLDRTHLQFFAEGDLVRLLADAGWQVSDAADVVSEHSDQSFPDEAPVLRPSTPLRDLLRSVRARAEPNGATYQFVRRYSLISRRSAGANEAEPERSSPFATVVVIGSGSRSDADAARTGLVEGDLAEQSHIDFRIVSLGPDDELGAAVAGATGRYVCVLSGRERLTREWMAAFVDAADASEAARGRVLRAGVAEVSDEQLTATSSADLADAADTAPGLATESFDALAADAPGAVVPAAYAVPAELVHLQGLRPEAVDGEAAVTVFLARCVQLAGVAPVAERTVLSTGSTAPGFLNDAVVEALGRDPYLLPVGSADRLLGRRDVAATARSTEERLQIALAGALAHARGLAGQRDDRVDALTAQLQRLEAERDKLVATLARSRGERRWRWLTLGRWRSPR
jgi:2-polyprenyl-3-methyl-5-hydroxy-6-metoxy-1,4-benzoquinol methylase